MGAAEHRIGRVVFDIAAPDQAVLSAFSDAVRARFDAVIEPALQAALDRIDRPGQVIRLGTVEVDLGTLDAPDADDLIRRIVHGLVTALSAVPPDETAEAETRDDTAELIGFLESGELPWPVPGRALAALAAVLAALDPPAMARLAARLRNVLIRRRAAERLVRQLPMALVRRLFRALLPEADALAVAAAFGPDLPAVSEALVPDALVSRVAEAVQRLAKADWPDLGEAIALFAVLDSRLPPALAEAAAPTQARTPPSAMRSGARTNDFLPALQLPDEPGDDADTQAPAVSRPVHAAGAVLLHPFLATLFARVGLLDAPGRFRDHAAQGRAVLLAHHLATGAEDAPEPETVLFKLLCGMEISDPVPRRIVQTPTEREEAASLLHGVITHWSKLGHTSAAGLREGFLLRPGRLRQSAGQWQLAVERQGIDILLDELPWTLSRVKTPFMRSILTVDWR
jgi:hypothetical protein